MSDLFERAERAAEFLRKSSRLSPKLGLVLGSGLGAFADEIEDAVKIPFKDVPGFLPTSAEGHAGKIVIGNIAGIPVVALQGRIHLYEGHTAAEVTFPLRVLGRLGVQAVVLTNAAGGIASNMVPGCLMVLDDHINLQGSNPLVGPNDPRFGPRFPDMADCYHERFRTLALHHGRKLGLAMFEGTYAALLGPSYETAAEIRMLRTLGADAVGMSTVSEVIVARHMGMKVLAISCITNVHGGLFSEKLSHEEVLATGERVRTQFAELLRILIPKLTEELH